VGIAMDGLEGRRAVVTGAASGIGRSVALRLSAEGCAVGLIDVDPDGMDGTAAAIRAQGGRVALAPADIGDAEAAQGAVRRLAEALGPADILVNCAGILRVGHLLEMPIEDWHLSARINIDGTLHCCRAAMPRMLEQGWGRVINLSSWLGKMSMKNYGAYAMSKFAVVAMTQTLALEVGGRGVTVNAICPGVIGETRMRAEGEELNRRLGIPSAEERAKAFPIGRLGKPEDIAGVAAFLASEDASYMTGLAVNVTGGMWLL
jgi:NAD(P)-dependent dehydrogenase (short-subunit alcohol dehydrogenase family)